MTLKKNTLLNLYLFSDVLLYIKRFSISLFIFFPLSLFFYSCNSVPKDYSKTPILFIHGHGLKAGHWNPFLKFLKSSGYPPEYLYAIDIKPQNGANILAAEEQIAPAVEELLKRVNNTLEKEGKSTHLVKKIDIISHGMGALSARWYAAKIRPDRIRVWLSLAGTNHGTSELCSYFGRGSEDCCPPFAKSVDQSLIQFTLNGNPHVPDVDETPFGIGLDSDRTQVISPDERRKIIYLTIWTDPSRWIKPEESALLDGCGGIKLPSFEGLKLKEGPSGNILIDEKMGHMQLLYSSKIHHLVLDLLMQADSSQITI
jgi:hypothetical protein